MAFRDDFLWGAAAASYQVEGAWDADGKGPNIWDVTIGDEGRIKHNEDGKVSADHYHHMKEDVALMKKLGLRAYRFSISWSRVLPQGVGEVNEAGLQFYDDLVNELIANDIEPLVTLFHWDYPYALETLGGWKNPLSPHWFLEYTKVVTDRLSDRVKYWMTFNEPQCSLGCGYHVGCFAPFQKLTAGELLQMGANMFLAHGYAVKYLRENAKLSPKISMAPYASVFEPKEDTPEAIKAAYEGSFSGEGKNFVFSMSYWSDPVYLGHYPEDIVRQFGDLIPEFTPEQWALVSQPLDFYGFNLYRFKDSPAGRGEYTESQYMGSPHTALNWPVTPEAMYWSVRFLYERYHLPVMVTENGMSEHDWVCLDGAVHDSYRIDFTHRYLLELKRAAQEYPVLGYMHWSVMDNFEWAEGYDERFGLIYVNYQTQERIPKDSAYWYRDVIATNGENL